MNMNRNNFFAMLNAYDQRQEEFRRAVRPGIRTAAVIAAYMAVVLWWMQ